jgi:hypothetical protein
MDYLPEGRGPRGGIWPTSESLRLTLRTGARLSQAHARPTRQTGQTHRSGTGPVNTAPLWIARRFGARAGGERGARLDRQKHHADQRQGRVVVFSGRDLHRYPFTRRSTAGDGALWQLPCLPRYLPHRCFHRPLGAGCAQSAFPTSPSSTTASHPGIAAPEHGQPHLRLRRLPNRLPLEQICTAKPASPTLRRDTP